VDSTVSCRLKRSLVIDNAKIQPGDVIIGLASFGQTTYEREYNSGIGSNGLTSARHDVLSKKYMTGYPESFDGMIPGDLLYSGTKSLTDPSPVAEISVGKLLLSPTRTYAPVMKKILDLFRSEIHGMVHCSGGGQTKILHFIDRLHIIKDNLFPVPPVFSLVQEESQTPWKEMYRVFNMGHRMELYVPENVAAPVIETASAFNLEGRIIGKVQAAGEKQLTIISPRGEFTY
jgi:phosphoribosylformylglycinamidine cyclo-ligase